jgi:hypothetical protein
MANIRQVTEWKPFKFFPWVEVRQLGAFLDTDPRIPLGLVPFWNEYRWRKKV